MTKEELAKREAAILELIQKLCEEKLNPEYAELCEKLLRKLGRKRVVPFATGRPEIWAVAIIHAIGSVNFLYDRSVTPHLTVEELNAFYGTSGNTISAKSKLIRNMFKLYPYDREFSTRCMRDKNPYDRFVMVDGMIMSIDRLPEDMQELVRDTRAKGGDISFQTRQQQQ